MKYKFWKISVSPRIPTDTARSIAESCTQNASKPADEWQTMDVSLIENRVTVVLNGVTVIDNKEIDGLTAMASDADEGKPGPIQVQGDHGAVDFRKLTITPQT